MAVFGIPDSVMPHVRRFGFSGAAAVALVIVMLTGINPITLISGKTAPPPAITAVTGVQALREGKATTQDYVQTIADESNKLWRSVFYLGAIQYIDGKLKTVATPRDFGCGMAGSAIGTFYCPEDQTVYIDLSSFETLRKTYPETAELAQAYRVARAFAHHAQGQLGLLDKFAVERVGLDEAVRVQHEQRLGAQADCLAALWAATVAAPPLIDDPATVVAIDASSAGEPVISLPSRQGKQVPETFSRPSDAYRKTWFDKGYAIPAGGTCALDKMPLPA